MDSFFHMLNTLSAVKGMIKMGCVRFYVVEMAVATHCGEET